jgi:hypothetical protein
MICCQMVRCHNTVSPNVLKDAERLYSGRLWDELSATADSVARKHLEINDDAKLTIALHANHPEDRSWTTVHDIKCVYSTTIARHVATPVVRQRYLDEAMSACIGRSPYERCARLNAYAFT